MVGKVNELANEDNIKREVLDSSENYSDYAKLLSQKKLNPNKWFIQVCYLKKELTGSLSRSISISKEIMWKFWW